MPVTRSDRGRTGEDMAADWYRRRGWTEVARNWRCREGEIDLVVLRPGQIAVVEVKARSGRGFGLPAEAVTPVKAQRLRGLALRFLSDRPALRSAAIRFDVVQVFLPEGAVDVIEGAF
jgi:putative endonuclease